jgi:tetratricopeptide (TPR) repeat protein
MNERMAGQRAWLVVLSLVVGCGGGAAATAPGAKDPSVQAESEYDIARDLWLRRGNPREALDHALKATELDPDNSEAQHLAALLYLDFCSRNVAECRLSEATRHARRAVSLNPEFREAKNTLAVVLIHDRKSAEAVQILVPLTQDILYQTPENAWGNLGWAYLELGKIDPAIDALRRSIAAQPRFCVGNYRLGVAYEKKGETSLARDAFTRALETDAPGCPALQEAWAGRARAHLRAGDQAAARVDLEHCATLSRTTTAGKDCGSMLEKLR